MYLYYYTITEKHNDRGKLVKNKHRKKESKKVLGDREERK